MKNRYVYHYCAQYQITPGTLGYIDGIAQLENKIRCMDDYTALKKKLNAPENVSIISLSFIGMEND